MAAAVQLEQASAEASVDVLKAWLRRADVAA